MQEIPVNRQEITESPTEKFGKNMNRHFANDWGKYREVHKLTIKEMQMKTMR